MRFVVVALLLVGSAAPTSVSSEATRPRARAALGLAVDLPADEAGSAAPLKVLAEVRRTGVSVFVLSISWSDAEKDPGVYHFEEVTRTARLLRQSGAILHLDLPLVVSRARDVPRDLADMPFDDARFSLRLGRFLAALRPALLDFSTVSLGYEADAFFADKPKDLEAFRRLFDGAVGFLGKIAPEIKVGVTTAAPTESIAPAVAAALHQRSPVLFYIYAPFVRKAPFVQRSPEVVEGDWKQLLTRAAGKPIAFPEVSYSSAAENGSTPEKQADFIRRFRRLVAAADGSTLLFARYSVWRDPQARSTAPDGSNAEKRRESFFAHRGLQTAAGQPKPAWRDWVNAGVFAAPAASRPAAERAPNEGRPRP